MNMRGITIISLLFIFFFGNGTTLIAYNSGLKTKHIKIGPSIDGHLDDPIWQSAKVFSNFRMVKPETDKEPSEKTELRVLYDDKNLYIGIQCWVNDPATIAVTDLAHDQRGMGSDKIRILLDPFQDKRNAYVFIVNAKGARTDGLATGEHFSTNWDGIWDAKNRIHNKGWSTEIRIPFKTISFNPKLEGWGFNVERYIAHRMEIIRLSGISKDSFFYNPAEAALLAGIKDIKQGKGITFKPYMSVDMGRNYDEGEKREWKINGGFDLYKNFTPNLVGVFTYQTDFAETEVDDRQINLSRFSVYYPEKRAFFLEGSEIFAFESGGGRRPSFVPFFSRNIGLYDEEQVPVHWGAKVYGKIGKTNIALLDVRTKPFNDLSGQNFFAGRIYQNIFSQSKIGLIFTSGEPGSDETNTLFGIDFKYATSRFMKNKNLAISGWWVTNKNSYTEGKHYGYGIKMDYPNDLFDIALTYNYFGDALEPGLGYMPRNSVQQISNFIQFRPRPKKGWLGKMVRQMAFRIFTSIYLDLESNIESSRISICPFTFARFESGDVLEFYFIPNREVLNEAFEVSDNIFILPGDYTYNRYQYQFRTASHRMISGKAEYETGGFYGGTMDKLELELNLNLKGNIRLGLEGTFVNADLPVGKFKENLYQAKADFYLNPNIGLMTYVQYDSVSEDIGANIRFKWRISPGNTIYLVYNKNWQRRYDPIARFYPLEDRGIFKVQFSWRP
jgi:Domain of unknown function (DUF5916)/Carbohydrate family 9 binding domain-like